MRHNIKQYSAVTYFMVDALNLPTNCSSPFFGDNSSPFTATLLPSGIFNFLVKLFMIGNIGEAASPLICL